MQLQLITLIIWPKAESYGPRLIHFKKGRVNVITGGSRTGKSAIIPIIDYCLASSECQIPIDTIRDHSAWYGLVMETENEQLLIARNGPKGRTPSDEFFFMRGQNLSIPWTISAPNEKIENVKHMLNAEAGTPYFRLSGADDTRPYQERLSFRDLMALVFQSQEVVANQNILFYKTHAHEHRERLKNWLPYILGAESLDVLAARQRLSEVQTKLTQLRREHQKANAVSSNWSSNMLGHLQVAKSYGLLEVNYELPENPSPSDLINTAREILASSPNHPKPSVEQIAQAAQEMQELEKQDDALSDGISTLRKRLEDITRLKAGLTGYGATAKRRADRLQISKWLEDIAREAQDCPLCGEAKHDKSQQEISKIATAFEAAESEAVRTKEIPTSFAREELALSKQLAVIIENRKALTKRIDITIAQNKAAKEQFDRRQNMYFYLGHLKASVDIFANLVPDGELASAISALESEERGLLQRIDPDGVQRRLAAALRLVSQKALARLQTLDAEDKYKRTPPEFSVKDLSLKVLSNEGDWHFLAEVGSASNWLSFHIAFICALHEFFNEQAESCVPSFAVFDQPSQVYFPKTVRGIESDDKSQYGDEDVQAVIGIFKTLANSVRAQKGKWQCIVLDHARDEIYGTIADVYEVDVWRDGEKLIPLYWYQ